MEDSEESGRERHGCRGEGAEARAITVSLSGLIVVGQGGGGGGACQETQTVRLGPRVGRVYFSALLAEALRVAQARVVAVPMAPTGTVEDHGPPPLSGSGTPVPPERSERELEVTPHRRPARDPSRSESIRVDRCPPRRKHAALSSPARAHRCHCPLPPSFKVLALRESQELDCRTAGIFKLNFLRILVRHFGDPAPPARLCRPKLEGRRGVVGVRT